jgi:AcrR family transcriptional regulator
MSIIQCAPQAGEATRDRRARLLASAARAFATNGFKAASLREIASTAGVSLTLVDHHFGSKEKLLLAVVASHHEICKRRMAGFREVLHAGEQPASLARLVEVWVRYEFELSNSAEGADYLLFLTKLMNDQHVGSGIRQMLDCSEPIVVNALAVAMPAAIPAARGRSFIVARGALHAAIIDCGVAMDAGLIAEINGAIDFCTAFILAGLKATLNG